MDMETNAAESIRVVRDGGVATITLNRPAEYNAYTPQMGVELYSALAAADDDEAVRAIVVTGAGRHFCAGAELTGGDTFASDPWGDAEALEVRTRPWNMGTPVIAAINGAAVGIGATMLLRWDIRLASERTKIGFVFTRRGITPELGSTWMLPRLIGMGAAMDLMLTGRLVRATEAKELGLVNEVIGEAELLNRARAIAGDIAANTAPAAVAATKRLLWRQLLDSDPVTAKAREDVVFFASGKTADAAEGVTAFLDKREPQWTQSKADVPNAIASLLPGERSGDA